VAKIVTMPNTPNFVRSNFVLRRAVGSVASPYTGKVRTQEYDGVFWEATVTLPPMRRDVAKNWQSFLLELNGPVNHFKFADPDALTNQGTYDDNDLKAKNRINQGSIELDFSATTQTITAPSNTTPFTNAVVGDFIVVTGSANPENNGTHKITTKTNAYTVVVESESGGLVTEADKTGCTIKSNQKGATGLNLSSSSNSATGTIVKGDYLQITSSSTTGANPVQYVMVTGDATLNVNAGEDTYGVKIQPKLRTAITENHLIRFATPKGLFRLTTKDVDWDADNISNYGISFSCIEVV
jgi:hypothetical protein|tara:strand:+ start:233 stop:1123 length:891 start_codon:yes stop_codon:yes gene_type:complete